MRNRNHRRQVAGQLGWLAVSCIGSMVACYGDGDTNVDSEDAAAGHVGEQDTSVKPETGMGGLDGGLKVDTANSAPQDAAAVDQCYPPCIAKVRSLCNVAADETSVCSKTADEILICNSGGTRSRLFDEMMEGVKVGTTVRTLPDGKTICFSQSNRPGLEPIWLMRDGSGKTIAFQRGENIVCADDGKEYKVDSNSPACKAIVSPYMCKSPTPGACEWLGSR